MNAETLLSATFTAGTLKNGVLAVSLFLLVLAVGIGAKVVAARWQSNAVLKLWMDLLFDLTADIQKVIVPRIKAAMGNDGKIDDAELKAIQEAAVNELRRAWGDDHLARLAEAAHIPYGALGAWVVQQILDKVLGEYKPPAPVDPLNPAPVPEPAPVGPEVYEPTPTVIDDSTVPDVKPITPKDPTDVGNDPEFG